MIKRALLFAGTATATLVALLEGAIPPTESVSRGTTTQPRAAEVLYVQLAPSSEEVASWRAAGRRDALRDFKAGQLVLLSFGLTTPDNDFDRRAAALGIRIRPMGCDISKSRLTYGSGYAETMRPLIESRLGGDVWRRLAGS